ncbi:MAG: alpha/beta fold hydrolase [Chitinophagaceae bacterium]
MKNIIITFLFIFLPCCILNAQPQNVMGDWEGTLSLGKDLHIVFHFNNTGDGTISATMDSPDQNVNGLPCSEVKLFKDSIIVSLKIANAHFDGKFLNDSTISGAWFQGPGNYPLVLKKGTTEITKVKPGRPQTPVPPFDYISEDIIYKNADGSIQYGATITYPKTGAPFAVALLITGSGQQDRDETVFDHKPFAVIADYLTKNGIAVLRVDDRGIGKTTGQLTNVTTMDFANDVLAGIQYLLQRKDVDKNKIGLIGHSEGGLIAPIVFTKWPQLAFIVSLAGPGVPGADILLRQQTDPLKGNISDSAFNSFFTLTKNTFELIQQNKDKPDSIILDKIKTYYAGWKQSTPASLQAEVHANTASPEDYAKQVSGELKPWLKYFITTDPADYWSKVKCPVLALDGDKDIQVYAEQNIPAIQAALQKAGNKKVTTKIFPGLNHLFQHCTKCTVEEYAELTETISPEVLETISTWLHQTIQ